ncbi:MAG TPA: protein kinase, partial [Polyangiaceae bacterium]|nr:protein kinase [Polyangiaceae bacterium]
AERTPVRLGRYEIVQKLGSGGMADVFLAHQPGPFSASKLIVIKQLRAGMMDDEQFVHMFADESRIAVRLNHPNVVQTYEAVAEGSDYYLVLEFLDGRSLHQILSHVTRAEMPLELHLWILTQVLAGLHYAHELKEFDGSPMGIVHRDVSPSNVFVTHSGEVKLLDFGIAKSVGAISATREGIIKGKLGYAAPEQCLCREVDRRTDLFAVGVMLWEAIAGCKRPMGETEASTYQARVQGTELPIERAAPKAPAELVKICNRALERHPERRFQTALEFRKALDHFLESTGWSNGTEHLRTFMHDQFAAEIEEMRRRIDEHLGKSRSMGGRPLTTLAALDSLPPNTHSGDIQKPTARPVSASILAWARRPVILAAGTAACLTVIAAVVWLNRAEATSSVVPSSTAQAMPSPAGPVSATPAPQRATQVSVVLTATPSTAEIRLDGRRISNPYRAAHGRDSASHHLAVSLPGFETSEQDLSFERDVERTVNLVPLPELRRGPTRLQAPPSVATKSRAPNESPEPGDILRTSRKLRKIDESA